MAEVIRQYLSHTKETAPVSCSVHEAGYTSCHELMLKVWAFLGSSHWKFKEIGSNISEEISKVFSLSWESEEAGFDISEGISSGHNRGDELAGDCEGQESQEGKHLFPPHLFPCVEAAAALPTPVRAIKPAAPWARLQPNPMVTIPH